MRRILVTLAVSGAVLCGAAAFAPASATVIPNPSEALKTTDLVTPARWVCDRGGNCVWRGPQSREFYYGPPGWKHCDYRWRTGPHGPYRQRLCW
ncbi:hypothetical protein [Microvirga flavescens]|uniref:hypothetical protein n=1 Tax=Microvirga flavescens TaxID=2249811 RepID=UPI001300670B|nr:hypothetical protein [Microvirga flavescens]